MMNPTLQHLTLKSLDTEPIERIDEGDGLVRFTSIRLLSPGVWSDAGSETATYYPPEGIANLEAHYDPDKHDGPPVNIMHDLDMDEFQPHEASVAGYIDPETLDTDDEGNLYGDLVFDTSNGAGQYAAENLEATLNSEGAVGFGGPSVEIPAEGLQQTHDQARDMPRVDGGRLSGAGMVFNPASKSVNFAREAARRPIAMADGSKDAKALTLEGEDMRALEADPADIRDALDQYGLGDVIGDMDDEEMMDFAGRLHDDIMDLLAESDDTEMEYEDKEKDDYEDKEKGEHEDEDDEEDTEMEDEPNDDMDALRDSVANLSSRLEDVEDALSQAMTADDVDAELEDATGNKLADAETVKTLQAEKEELEQRVEELENVGKESKTLTDAQNAEEDFDWSTADDGVSYDPATGSMSR